MASFSMLALVWYRAVTVSVVDDDDDGDFDDLSLAGAPSVTFFTPFLPTNGGLTK